MKPLSEYFFSQRARLQYFEQSCVKPTSTDQAIKLLESALESNVEPERFTLALTETQIVMIVGALWNSERRLLRLSRESAERPLVADAYRKSAAKALALADQITESVNQKGGAE
jgi:hypothetical protein